VSSVTLPANMKTQTHTGIVKFFIEKLGYGFIGIAPSVKQANGMSAEADLYVHATGISKHPKVLEKDQRVEFEVKHAARGPVAINVKVLKAGD